MAPREQVRVRSSPLLTKCAQRSEYSEFLEQLYSEGSSVDQVSLATENDGHEDAHYSYHGDDAEPDDATERLQYAQIG